MKYRVLIVDDNPKNLQIAAATLDENNYQVEVALNGKAALSWLERSKFDVILLDVMMPDLDGYETCKAIKSNPSNANVPIIFLTARHDIASMTAGFLAGGVDYITKPFNTEELLARLATHIELKVAKETLLDVNRWLEEEVAMKTAELKEANATLEKANSELLKLDQSKNDFLKAISHEIRTPLNGIVGAMNLLKNSKSDPFFEEVMAVMDVSVSNLEKYSYAALQIANLQLRGEDSLGFQMVDLVALSNACLGNLEHKAQTVNTKLSITSKCDEAFVMADFNYLQNAINALLDSALIFTPSGTITLSVEENAMSYKLSLEDDGSLFADTEVSHFFDSINNQNYQFKRNNAMELYLAKMIIQLHNGSLSLQNKPTQDGTLIIVTLPKPILEV